MAKRGGKPDIARYWPRLREEAHELYREAALLRGRIRELERQLTGAQNTAARLRIANENLTASAELARARLRSIEGSRGWRAIMKVRGVLRRRRREIDQNQIPGAPVQSESPAAKPAVEPTFAQLRAAEAARRAEVAGSLAAWIETARAARGSVVHVIAGDPTTGAGATLIDAAQAATDPILVLEREPHDGIGGLPPGIVPTLVPDLLAVDVPGKEKLFICTTSNHAAIRWLVPAQQQGWWTAFILDGPISAGAVYLASHADVAVVADDDAARSLEAASGIRPLVASAPSARVLLDASRAGWESLPRAVLGGD